MTITLLYAGLIGLWLLVLASRVIIYRRTQLVELGTADQRDLELKVRAQGNLMEYAPFALLLLAMIEFMGAAAWLVHGFGVLFLVGRLLHGYSFSFADGWMRGRVLGMILTLTMLGGASSMAIVIALSG